MALSFDDLPDEPSAPKAGGLSFDDLPDEGQLSAGNINLNNRPRVKNPDGSISTVRSMSANFDGQEVLIPTVSDDGRIMSDDEAIQTYRTTGKHLGKFDNPDHATAFAERLHNSQAAQYVPQAAGQVMMDDGQMQAPLSPLVAEYAQNPRIQAAQGIKRGTLAGEAAAFGPMLNQAFHQTLIPSMIDYQQSGAADRSAAEDANWRAGMLDGGLDQLTPRQREMAMLDPVLAQQGFGLDDIPERSTTPDAQRRLAQELTAAAIPKEATFGQQQRLDRAESEAIPSYTTADGPLARTFAGAGSLAANLLGSVPAVENLVPVSRGKTVLETARRAFLPNAAAGVIADPVVQANQIGAGLQDKYSGEQTALAGVVGGVAGSALNSLGHVPPAIRGWIEARAAKRMEDMAPDEAAQWFRQAQDASNAAGESMADPAFTAEQVQQNTGLNAARPTDPASVKAQRAANKVRGSELAETFNDINVWPRDQVQVGPEGIDIPDGTAPVRDAAGEQARVDTLASRGQAADMAREMGIENPSARDLDTIVNYIENGLSPRGAVNAFRRAATAGARDERGMTPDLARTEGEKANSQQFAKEAFDIADLRRQRREAELDKWEPELEPDYSAGAGRASELTPRMQQDLAARSEAPYAGPAGHVGTDQPAPRRSVDVIGSKSVGGLRGEYLPGQRPNAPEGQPARAGETFAGERTEPLLEGPVDKPATERPAEAPVEAGPVEPVAPDNVTPIRSDVPEWRQKPKVKPTEDKENLFRYEQWEDQQYLDASPEVKAQADDLEARADAEYGKYHKLNRNGQEGYNQPRPSQEDMVQAMRHNVESFRLRIERSRLLRGSDDLMNPVQKANFERRVSDLERYEAALAESKKPKGVPDPEPKQPSLAERRQTPEGRAATADEKMWYDYQSVVRDAEQKASRAENGTAEQKREAAVAKRDLENFEKRHTEAIKRARQWHDGSQGREAPAAPTPETKASPPAEKAPGDAEQLRQLEHELSLSRYFEDDAATVADLEQKIAALKGEAPEAAPKAEPAGALDAATVKALDERLSRVNWDEKGGKLLRDAEGKPSGRTKWLSNDPDVHKVLTEFGYSSTEARNLLNRSATGKGRPLTEKQQRFVDALQEAHKGPQDDVGDDFALDSHTDADLQARDRETQQAKDKADKQRTAAENKAQADKERDDFILSGSDRPADVAASRGQNTLFDVTGAAVHSGKTAIGAVGKGIKALVKAVWQGDDSRNAREHARDLAEPLAQLIERKGPAVESRVRAGIRKFFESAESSLKSLTGKTDSPILKQLGDVFHATAGKGDSVKPTLDERSQRALFGGKKGYMNRAEGIHNFLHDNKLEGQKTIDQIIKLVENPGTPRTGKVGEAANMISEFFKDAHAYLKEAGIDMGEVKGYFPREHDASLVEAKRTHFVDAAAKAYKHDNPALSPTDARAKAEEYWSAVVHGRDVPPGSGAKASNNPKPDFMKGRIFSKEAAKHLEPFYSRNIGGMLSNYALRAVRRAEVAKSGVDINGKFQPFGDNFANWKTITDAALKEDPQAREVMDQVNQLVSVNAGIPTSNYGRTAENAMSWVRTVGTLGMLEKSALASVGELATSPLRGALGNAGDIANIAKNLGGHAINTLRAVVGKKGRSKSVKEAFAFADEIGATTESAQGSTAAARFEGNEPSSKIQSQLLTSFFKRNMLTPLTEYTRAMSAQQARIFMKRLADEAPGAKRDLLLRELGVKKGDEQAFADYVKQFGGKLPAAADLKGPHGDLYKNAALRFVDQSVQRPNAATKPAWASHPLGKMIFQFQSFNYAFQKNVLNRMVRLAVLNKDMSTAEKAKLAASFGISVSAMTGIQAMITELREQVYSRPDQKKLTPGAKFEGTVSRAGLLGAADPWIQMLNGSVRYSRDPSQSLLGPTLGQAAGTLGSFLAPNAEGTNTAERKQARMLYQTFGEPALQAALSATPAGPVSKLATVYGVPKLGEALTDKFIPDNKKHTKADDKPIKGMVESAAGALFGEDDEEPKAAGPQRAVRPARPQRPERPKKP